MLRELRLDLAGRFSDVSLLRAEEVRTTLFLLQVDLKPLREATVAVPAPKVTEKRKAEDADASKDLKKVSVTLFAQTVFDEPFNRLLGAVEYRKREREAVALKLGDEKRHPRALQGHYRVTSYIPVSSKTPLRELEFNSRQKERGFSEFARLLLLSTRQHPDIPPIVVLRVCVFPII